MEGLDTCGSYNSLDVENFLLSHPLVFSSGTVSVIALYCLQCNIMVQIECSKCHRTCSFDDEQIDGFCQYCGNKILIKKLTREENIEYYLHEAIEESVGGDISKAETYCNFVLLEDPGNTFALTLACRVMIETRRADRALEYLKNFVYKHNNYGFWDDSDFEYIRTLAFAFYEEDAWEIEGVSKSVSDIVKFVSFLEGVTGRYDLLQMLFYNLCDPHDFSRIHYSSLQNAYKMIELTGECAAYANTPSSLYSIIFNSKAYVNFTTINAPPLSPVEKEIYNCYNIVCNELAERIESLYPVTDESAFEMVKRKYGRDCDDLFVDILELMGDRLDADTATKLQRKKLMATYQKKLDDAARKLLLI